MDFSVPMNAASNIKRVIGVVSGKGGVGKTFVTAYLASCLRKNGMKVGILDADITGPSIPRAFGIHGRVGGVEGGIEPAESAGGIKVMSANLLLETEETPIIWRGALIASAVQQFWSDVCWGELDYLLVDMPPGTGDVPLTVFQSLPVDGIVVVTSPQELVSMIVSKAAAMAEAMEIPVLGLIENYSYLRCPHCGEKIAVFGESHAVEVAEEYEIPILGRLPMDSAIAAAMDAGTVEELPDEYLRDAVTILSALPVQKKHIDRELLAAAVDEKERMAEDFGTAPQFVFYTLQKGQLLHKEVCPAPGQGQEILCRFLLDKGATALLCGGIAEPARQTLLEEEIPVYSGLSGHSDVMAACYLDGSLRQ